MQRNRTMAEEKKKQESGLVGLIEALKAPDREPTKSERIMLLARERDKYYDMVVSKKKELEETKDADEKAFLKDSIASLETQKKLLAKRIKQLLDET